MLDVRRCGPGGSQGCSISSSAMASIVNGTEGPSALVVLRREQVSQENKCRSVGLGRRTSKANYRKIAAAGYGEMELPSTGRKAGSYD